MLYRGPGVIQSKTELETLLYGWQEEVESNAVEVYIHHLRAKIGRDHIETVRDEAVAPRLEWIVARAKRANAPSSTSTSASTRRATTTRYEIK